MFHYIDILLTTYNGEEFLGEELDSLLQQDFTGGTLLSGMMVLLTKPVRLLKNIKMNMLKKITLLKDDHGNLGSTKSFSVLVGNSKDPDIAFCDQDDVWLPEKLQVTFDKIKEVEKK